MNISMSMICIKYQEWPEFYSAILSLPLPISLSLPLSLSYSFSFFSFSLSLSFVIYDYGVTSLVCFLVNIADGINIEIGRRERGKERGKRRGENSKKKKEKEEREKIGKQIEIRKKVLPLERNLQSGRKNLSSTNSLQNSLNNNVFLFLSLYLFLSSIPTVLFLSNEIFSGFSISLSSFSFLSLFLVLSPSHSLSLSHSHSLYLLLSLLLQLTVLFFQQFSISTSHYTSGDESCLVGIFYLSLFLHSFSPLSHPFFLPLFFFLFLMIYH